MLHGVIEIPATTGKEGLLDREDSDESEKVFRGCVWVKSKEESKGERKKRVFLKTSIPVFMKKSGDVTWREKLVESEVWVPGKGAMDATKISTKHEAPTPAMGGCLIEVPEGVSVQDFLKKQNPNLNHFTFTRAQIRECARLRIGPLDIGGEASFLFKDKKIFIVARISSLPSSGSLLLVLFKATHSYGSGERIIVPEIANKSCKSVQM